MQHYTCSYMDFIQSTSTFNNSPFTKNLIKIVFSM